MSLLEVTDLRAQFGTSDVTLHAVDGVSFQVNAGETLGIVGESGSGKSVTALSMMRLLPKRASKTTGAVVFDGVDLLQLNERQIRRVRGAAISMIFQDPMTSLNPMMTVGRQITEMLRLHLGMNRLAARRRAIELLDMVGVADAARRADQYSSQLSGGMRQRAMIAMALSCNPKLVLADEITTALDVTIQAQILDLVRSLGRELSMAFILITHDLAVVSSVAHRVLVMYAGRIVEQATARELFANPRMPYTWGLLRSLPRLGPAERNLPLVPIEGMPPDLTSEVRGCAFAPRCAYRREVCMREEPALRPVIGGASGHKARCWGVQDGPESGWLGDLNWRAEPGQSSSPLGVVDSLADPEGQNT